MEEMIAESRRVYNSHREGNGKPGYLASSSLDLENSCFPVLEVFDRTCLHVVKTNRSLK